MLCLLMHEMRILSRWLLAEVVILLYFA